MRGLVSVGGGRFSLRMGWGHFDGPPVRLRCWAQNELVTVVDDYERVFGMRGSDEGDTHCRVGMFLNSCNLGLLFMSSASRGLLSTSFYLISLCQALEDCSKFGFRQRRRWAHEQSLE